MKSKSVYKVPNGKLLKIFIDYDDQKLLINKINITGDFFAYPEESIECIENELKNTALKKDVLLTKIDSIIEKNNIDFIGLNTEGLVEGILRCVR
jgi:lipoate-protein ligase A